MQNLNSEKLYARATQIAPAGVHSPVRAFRAVGGTPIFFQRGLGSQLIDNDQNSYIDFCMCWGALAAGHAHPQVVAAITEQVTRGTHYGTPTALDVELGEKVLSYLKIFDRLRFVNSGTEAVMTAIRLARGYTNRNKIVKIDGCYHGHVDSLLVAAGSGLMTQGLSSSKGVTPGTVQDTLVIPYGSTDALDSVFAKFKSEIAAVIIEPVLANSGLFVPDKTYLEKIRKITSSNGALLIFDEVISGFRVGPGGAAEYYDIKPDIGTYGKIIGGGLPVGAIASTLEIMSKLAPEGPVYQAGTLSGNPLCMAAGLATLKALETHHFYDSISSDLGPYLDQSIAALKSQIKYPLHYKRIGSIFWLCPGQAVEPATPADISPEAATVFREIYHKVLEAEVYLSPSVYEVSFLSVAHSKNDIDQLIRALKAS